MLALHPYYPFNTSMEILRVELDTVGLHLTLHAPERSVFRPGTEDVTLLITSPEGEPHTSSEPRPIAVPLFDPENLMLKLNTSPFVLKKRPRLLGAIHHYNQRRNR